MVYFECKKIFSKPAGKIALFLLAVMLCAVSYFAIGKVGYVDENGDRSIGITAARRLRNEKNQWAGYVTEEVLQKVLAENDRINHSAAYLSDNVAENDKAYSQKQGFMDIREMISRTFCSFQEYDYFRADHVTKEELPDFYERRVANLAEWLEEEEQKERYSPQKRQFLLEQYEKLETPFYYEYADGWNALLEYMPTLIMLVVLITGFLVAGIFADERQLKAEAVFFAAKFGRNKAVLAKIKAGFWVITAVYWVMLLLFSGIVLTVLGADGANCAIQTNFSNWKSFYQLTYLQDYLLTIGSGYLGSLFLLFLTMLLSAKTHAKALAVTLPFALLFLPSFLSGIPVLSEILGLLPDQLLQMSMAVKAFHLYQIGDRVMGAVPILLFLYTCLWQMLLPALYQVYRKTEVE